MIFSTQTTTLPAKNAGISFVELLIGIAIISTLTAVGLLGLSRDGPQVRETARLLMGDVTRARSEAIRLNTFVGFTVNYVNNSYSIFVDVDRDGVGDTDLDGDGVADIANSTLFSRSIKDQFPLAKMVSSLSISDGSTPVKSGSVWFDARGLPRSQTGGPGSGSGSVIITSNSNSNNSVTVTLETQGRVVIQ